jgi:hypothetical protein
LRKAIFDRDVAALDIAGFGQALVECRRHKFDTSNMTNLTHAFTLSSYLCNTRPPRCSALASARLASATGGAGRRVAARGPS